MTFDTDMQNTAMLLEHLAAGVRQNEALPEIVNALAESGSDPKANARLLRLSERLAAGEDLSRALGSLPELDEPVLTTWMDHAQAKGTLAEVLSFLSGDLLLRTRRQLQSRLALAWPALILVTTVFVSGLVSLFVLPALREGLDQLGMGLPQPSAAYFGAVISGGGVVTVGFIAALLALVVVLWLMFGPSGGPDTVYHWLRLDGGRNAVEVQQRVLPVLADATLVEHAAQALGYFAATTPIGSIRRRFEQAKAHVEAGDSLAAALEKEALLPRETVAHLNVARRTDNLPYFVDVLNQQLREKWVQASARFERTLTVIVYLVSAYLAFQLLKAVYLPIFQLGQAI